MGDERRARLLQLLARVGEELLSPIDPTVMAARIFDILKEELSLDAFFNYAPSGPGRMRLVAYYGISEQEAAQAAELEFGQAVCGMVAQHRAPIYEANIQCSSEPMLAFVKAVGLNCYACTPLLVNDELLGTLGFGRRDCAAFEEDEVAFLRTACHYVALAKHRAREKEREMEELRRQRDLLREREALRAKLAELNQLSGMSAIAATLAHELNQPLTAASNYLAATTQLVTARPEEAARSADAARKQVMKAGEIIRRIRSQIKGDHHREAVSVDQLFDEAIATARAAGIAKGVSIERSIDEDARHVSVDQIQIVQVLGNLIRNACDSMGDSPVRALTLCATRLDGRHVQVEVADTGAGIDPEIVQDLFNPEHVSRSGGLGLGLVICRAVVESHGGRIWAVPQPKRGSLVCFTLPAG